MASEKTKRRSSDWSNREQILAVFADFAEQDVDKLFEFMQHCGIDLEPLADKAVKLPDLIASHFYLRPGFYDIARLGDLLATFPPIAARIREIQEEMQRKV